MSRELVETAGQVAATVIRQQILGGELRPGTRLNQHELAAQLGMSRIPIRDALHSLAAEGLVQVRAHASAVVTELSIEDLQELYEIRISLEPRLGQLSVPNLTSHHFAVMESLLEQMAADVEPLTWLALNNQFHETMYAAADRRRTLEIIRRIRHQTDRYTAIHIEVDRDVVDREHRMILEAARLGHITRLEALITAHISFSYEKLLRYLASEGRPTRSEEEGAKPK